MTVPRVSKNLRVIAVVGGILLLASNCCAQLPATRLSAVFPAGGQSGQTLDVSIAGGDLDDVNQLEFSHPGISASVKMSEPGPFDAGPQPVENTFVVAVGPDVPVGHYSVRAIGKYGRSNARTFVVGPLPSSIEKEPNDEPASAGDVVIPGVIEGQFGAAADVDYFRFSGQAGQTLTIEGFAHRIDSRATLRFSVFDENGRVLGDSHRGHSSDAFAIVTLPSAGSYVLRVRDSLHGGGPEFPYRISLSSSPLAEFVFPPAGLPGSNEEYTIYGYQLPGGQPSPYATPERPLQQLTTRIAIPGDISGRLQFSERIDPYQYALDGIEYRVSSPQGLSNPVLVSAALAPVVREQANNDTPATVQKLTQPCEVAGQFFPQRDVDWYSIEAKAGEVFWIELICQRLGLPTDPSMVIQKVGVDDQGKEVVTVVANLDDVDVRHGSREFDQRSFDPAYRLVAPSDGTYRILVRDGYTQNHRDPGVTYRLLVRNPQPDFRLVAVPMETSGCVLLRKGGREAIRVIAARREGFDGEITLTVSGLPAGVTSSDVILGPANHFTTVVLSADANAAPGHGSIQISGKAMIGGTEVVRTAKSGMSMDQLPFAQPNGDGPSTRARLTDQISISISPDETSRVAMTLGDGKLIETSRGGLIKIPYAVVRQEGAAGNITGFPIGLPPNVGVPQVAVGSNTSGEFELRLQATAPPGTYSFYLAGSIQGLNYARNPEAAAKAKENAEKFATILTETQQKQQQAQQKAQQTATDLTKATSELTAAKQAKTAADTALKMANDALKSANDQLVAARKQSDAKPEDAALKEQLTKVQKDVDAAAMKSAMALENQKMAEIKQTEATARHLLADESQKKSGQEVQTLQRLVQQAQQEKQRKDQRSQQLQQQATMRGVNVNIPSTPVTIRIAEYPVKVSGTPGVVTVKQGAMADIPFKVERLFGFAADVTGQCVVPSGVAGLQVANARVEAGQSDGKFIITAQPAATPGEHAVTLRYTMNLNGQNLILDQPLRVIVEKVEPASR
ncbi:MAG: hypothetical protein ACK58L_19095 [Planctomycetota bacterium]